jgi:hypothetical protein
VFSVWSVPSNSRTRGLCYPFLGNGSVYTYPCIESAMQRGDVINNRDVVSVGPMQSAITEVKSEASTVQGNAVSRRRDAVSRRSDWR